MGSIYSPPNTSLLRNGTRINGVEHFYQSTKPATRVDGSALVVGDQLITPTGNNYTWNGLAWIQELGWSIAEYRGTGTSGSNEQLLNVNGFVYGTSGRRFTQNNVSIPTGMVLTQTSVAQLSGNTLVATGLNSGNVCSQVSTDNGVNWGSVNTIKTGSTSHHRTLIKCGITVIAATGTELYESSDGITWSLIYTIPVAATDVRLFTTAANTLLVGVYVTSTSNLGKIYRGVKSGTWTFTETNSTYNFLRCGQFATGRIVAFPGETLIAYTSPGMAYSDDDGVTWQYQLPRIGITSAFTSSIFTINGRLFFLETTDYSNTSLRRIYSIDSALNVKTELNVPAIDGMCLCPFFSNTIFAMGSEGGSYDRLLLITKVENQFI